VDRLRSLLIDAHPEEVAQSEVVLKDELLDLRQLHLNVSRLLKPGEVGSDY
jgi:hypothetical protein